jgi:Holliday junction resolvasome RuvABC endonuclease subunit
LFLPTGRAVDPATGKTGINPDVVVNAADSLRKAQILALKAIQEKADANKRKRLEEIIRRLEETN